MLHKMILHLISSLYRIFLFAGVSSSTVIKTEKPECIFSHEKVKMF